MEGVCTHNPLLFPQKAALSGVITPPKWHFTQTAQLNTLVNWCAAKFFLERILLEGFKAFKIRKKKSFSNIHFIRWYSKTKPWRLLSVKALTGVWRSFGWATTQQLGSSRRSFALLFFSSMTTWPPWANSGNGESKEPWLGCGANPALQKNIFTNPWTLNTV